MNKRTKQEIDHFSKLEHIWWGAQTEVGQRRYDRKAEALKKLCRPKKGEQILEIGCGDGEFTGRIAKGGVHILATDITPAVISRAKKSLKLKGVRFAVDNAEDLAVGDNSVDIVCGVSILHHLDTRKALEQAFRVLKRGGRLFFTEPNLVNPVIFLGLNVEYLRKRMEFSPDETALLRWRVTRILKECGFRTVEVKNYDFLYPHTPPELSEFVEKLSGVLEKIPVVKEVSGSLLIYAVK